MARMCPGCGSPMRDLQIGGVDVCICETHACVWFPARGLQVARSMGASEFDAILSAVPVADTSDSDHPTGACPDCGGKLETFEFAGASGIFITSCSKCLGSYVTREDVLAMDNRFKTINKTQLTSMTPLSPEEQALFSQMFAGQVSSSLTKSNIGRAILNAACCAAGPFRRF